MSHRCVSVKKLSARDPPPLLYLSLHEIGAVCVVSPNRIDLENSRCFVVQDHVDKHDQDGAYDERKKQVNVHVIARTSQLSSRENKKKRCNTQNNAKPVKRDRRTRRESDNLRSEQDYDGESQRDHGDKVAADAQNDYVCHVSLKASKKKKKR